ncbi:peroxidase-like [Lolium perenne]|uniref:peroxidase-like n=1 Tax=Lolium perenne TaxID=4522 RepID=UPI0021F60674|nr:peroxidase-like [Lolium perenne]XP_051210864.1 peroxidase-like [Lolium perenne]
MGSEEGPGARNIRERASVRAEVWCDASSHPCARRPHRTVRTWDAYVERFFRGGGTLPLASKTRRDCRLHFHHCFVDCHGQYVPLGRRDSTSATGNTGDLPGPGSSLAQLQAAFAKKNLNTVDMVALSGAHTIGRAQCQNFRSRIYGGDTNINAAFATSLKANCPQSGGNGNLAALDATTANAFDNAYYTNLLSQKGLLHSDQVLFNNATTDNTVRNFASSGAAFSSAFATAMVKMGNISPLTGTQGQIRLSCSKVNS